MKNPIFDEKYYEIMRELQDRAAAYEAELRRTPIDNVLIQQNYWLGVLTYINDFMIPFWISLKAFLDTEKSKIYTVPLIETVLDYLKLFQFNLQIAEKGLQGTTKNMKEFGLNEVARGFTAWINTFFNRGGEDISAYTKNLAKLMNLVIYEYPKAIKSIEEEYGFHFERDGYVKTAETDRFVLYQVLPNKKGVQTRKHGKPIIIIPPYVLGANILAFLPGENKSYVHAFANQGIPTYIRVLKDIQNTPALQVMTGEDDARDTRIFCEKVKALHGQLVTLNGFCQGGFIAVLDILSGELDGLVDALITCVAPMDGSRSKALTEYLQHLPARFRDLGYAVKNLPNGNRIVDGKVMSWVYKLKSMEKEAPLAVLYRDLMNLESHDGKEVQIGKTAAALNHWITYDRNDLPESITKLSFDSYTIPVSPDGTLPVTLFGKKPNFKAIKEKGIKWLLCCAEHDDLVDSAASQAPMDFVDTIELTVFPKGHGAIATSWSNPDTEFAVNKRFGSYRGPVRYQLDLEEELQIKTKKKSSKIS
jgi:hypothetical protein